MTAVFIIGSLLWQFENFTVKVTECQIESSKIQEEIHIALLSDLHGMSFGKDNKALTDKVEKLSPDIVLILGDMYSSTHKEKAGSAVELVKSLAEIAPVYLIHGEHDDDIEYISAVSALKNVNYLSYSGRNVTVRNNQICIYGIDNVYFPPDFTLNNKLKLDDESKFNILLSHIPNSEIFKSFNADVIFSGDTHGGMMRLPFFGCLYFDGFMLPKLTYSGTITDKGLFDFNKNKLFVTSGLGSYPLPARVFNRPEICMITIKKEIKK